MLKAVLFVSLLLFTFIVHIDGDEHVALERFTEKVLQSLSIGRVLSPLSRLSGLDLCNHRRNAARSSAEQTRTDSKQSCATLVRLGIGTRAFLLSNKNQTTTDSYFHRRRLSVANVVVAGTGIFPVAEHVSPIGQREKGSVAL